MAKRPWRSHHTRDWATDPFVRSLDLEARMVYLELLDIAWDEGGLRQEWVTFGTYVAGRIGVSRRKFVACWDRIRGKFAEISPGIWSNPRLENERIRAEEFSEKQSIAGKLRHAGSANAKPAGWALAQPSQSQSQSQSQEEREEEKKPAVADAPPSLPGFDLGEPESKKQKRNVDQHLTIALEILTELNAARSRVRPTSRVIRPMYSSLGGIAARIAAGRTLEECLRVVATGEDECTRKPESFDWFDAVSPWRPENFERRLAADTGGSSKSLTNGITRDAQLKIAARYGE